MDQEATNPEFAEIGDLDDEEGSGSGPRCLKFEVLRELVNGGEGAWVCIDGGCSL
jgi:hypothetical protein